MLSANNLLLAYRLSTSSISLSLSFSLVSLSALFNSRLSRF